MPTSPTAEGFWRCGRCRTPNPSAAYIRACVGCGAPRPAEARPAAGPSRGPAGRGRGRGRALEVATWAFAAVLLGALGLMKWRGDLWWPATLLLYMPRWPWLLPTAALAAANVRVRLGRLWGVHAALAAVILGPLMGLHLPWARWLGGEAGGGRPLRIMTINLGMEDAADPDRLIALIEDERIDVVCFQEGRSGRKAIDPRLEAFFGRGWWRDRRNFIASRLPIVAEWERREAPFPEPHFWPVRLAWVEVRAEDGSTFRVADVHMPTPFTAFQRLLRGDLAAVERFHAWRRAQVPAILEHAVGDTRLPVLLAGDFNASADSPLLDPLRSRFRIAHEEAGLGYGYTRPASVPWVGIDHVLATPEWAITGCRVGADVGSDHLPLIAEVALRPGPR